MYKKWLWSLFMGKTMLFIIIIGMLLFAGISFVVYKYIDGLASG